ncbi:MAG: hypothetical protein HC866_18370 [Leptolyngbyaceae cyanobacterium RU_5_1]|nr:hypothetical protein [Leptolyngbyaceae cyanobacterium RU_5_1]
MRRLLFSASLFVLFAGLGYAQTASAQTGSAGSNSGSSPNYPYGTRIHETGVINTPRGQTISPSVSVPNGDGSITYYYSNGSSVTIHRKRINPNGALLSPGAPNGGLTNRGTIPRTETFYKPERFKK